MLSIDQVVELTNSGLVPYLRGPRGEGKTTFVNDLAKSLGKTIKIMNLSAIESTDFCGLPFIDEKGVSRYAIPSFLKEAEILFLDEIDRVRDSAVKSSLLSLLIDRSINGHALRADCKILTAGNGTTDEKSGHEYDTVEFDEAMKDRLIEIPFKFSDKQKLDYLRKNYSHNKFMRFLEAKPELFKKFSGRRIESFMKVSNEYCQLFLDKETSRLFTHFIESNLVTLQDVLTNQYELTNMSAITRASLIAEVGRYFYDVKDSSEATNINTFVNALRAEEKGTYFTQLKKLCLEEPEKFKNKAIELDKMGMFKGQKAYLAELAK